jgi:GH35 family endo-1,4-beta-xylanase
MPKDPKEFGRFAEALAQRYKGKIHAIEVWNEQNLAIENGGNVTLDDVGRYVEMVKEGYTRVKAVDPSIVVVAGALSSTGENNPTRGIDDISYYKAMYTYNNGELKNYMDAQGFHPATTLNPPEKLWPDDPGPGCAMDMKSWCDHPTHYFRHIENVRKVMQDSGVGDKKIWITEIGWATQNNTPGYEYGNYISPEQQAEYLERALAMTVFKYSDFVGTVFLWNLNFAVSWEQQGNPLHEQAAFGILNGDWSPRPAFTRVQGFIVATKTSTKD